MFVLVSRKHDEILHRLSPVLSRDGDDALRNAVQRCVQLTHDITRDAESFKDILEESGVKIQLGTFNVFGLNFIVCLR